MKVAVWNTHIKRQDGNIMYFDVLVPDAITNEQNIFDFGKDYLSQFFGTNKLSAKECRLCHMQHVTGRNNFIHRSKEIFYYRNGKL